MYWSVQEWLRLVPCGMKLKMTEEASHLMSRVYEVLRTGDMKPLAMELCKMACSLTTAFSKTPWLSHWLDLTREDISGDVYRLKETNARFYISVSLGFKAKRVMTRDDTGKNVRLISTLFTSVTTATGVLSSSLCCLINGGSNQTFPSPWLAYRG